MNPITFQHCPACGHNWYLDAAACPECGSAESCHSSLDGIGIVTAKSTIHRAPDKLLQQYAPYTVCLVSMPQGFTVMGHLRSEIAVGDRAEFSTVEFGGSLIPAFYSPSR